MNRWARAINVSANKPGGFRAGGCRALDRGSKPVVLIGRLHRARVFANRAVYPRPRLCLACEMSFSDSATMRFERAIVCAVSLRIWPSRFVSSDADARALSNRVIAFSRHLFARRARIAHGDCP